MSEENPRDLIGTHISHVQKHLLEDKAIELLDADIKRLVSRLTSTNSRLKSHNREIADTFDKLIASLERLHTIWGKIEECTKPVKFRLWRKR